MSDICYGLVEWIFDISFWRLFNVLVCCLYLFYENILSNNTNQVNIEPLWHIKRKLILTH